MPAGRFAPSPTGPLHLGNLRTALLAWLFARSSASLFHVRIEDLDPDAVRERWIDGQLHDLDALGLDWDGAVLRQSTRLAAHHDAIGELVAAGRTYRCYCTRREIQDAAAAPHGDRPEGAYPGTCRHLTAADRAERERSGRLPALRLRAGGEVVGFTDRLHGQRRGPVDDFVLRRGDGTPAYNLAVVVDDAAQGIGEVVRGDDLLDSTPRQVLLAEILGLPVPGYAHVPLMLGPDGARLAKRHGAVTLDDLAMTGSDASAVRARLAASLGLADAGESPSLSELVARFDPAGLPRVPWVPDF